jgi:hemerythrin
METWNDAYSVGVREMDEQHKRLLGYIGVLGELLVTRDE